MTTPANKPSKHWRKAPTVPYRVHIPQPFVALLRQWARDENTIPSELLREIAVTALLGHRQKLNPPTPKKGAGDA